MIGTHLKCVLIDDGEISPRPTSATIPPVPDERDDAELVRLVAADDMDALRVLYERYGSIVFGMARRVLGDRQLAEECTQDVFVALWRGAAKYEPERARVSTWLIGITRYRAIDLVRRRAARPVDPYGEIWQRR